MTLILEYLYIMYHSIYKRLPAFVLLFCLFGGNALAQPFITTWKTDNTGPSNDDQITIPINTGAVYDYSVDWGDGLSDTGVIGSITHTYASPGTYTVSISGVFPRIYFDGGGFFGNSDTDFEKILTVEQWGNIAWTSMAGAFSGCENLRINATDAPDLSVVTDMTEMFYDATAMDDNINSWNVVNVEVMNSLFRNASAFNQPLDSWVTDNVIDMNRMFSFASAFDQDIGGWNVGNVEDMGSMLAGATSFNHNIGSWVVTNVSNMNQMFSVATSFNQDIGGWVTSSLTNMTGMFNGATVFDQDISGWNISGVSSMSFVFANTDDFNQDLSAWVTTDVNNMSGMFSRAESFNQNISGWDVSGVSNMSDMFRGAIAFNQDINEWVVSGVSNMSGMFEDATSFNQNISGWTVENVTNMRRIFNNSDISVDNYDNILINWSTQSLRSNVTFNAANISYCAGESARTILETTFSWTITDGGQGCIIVYDGNDASTPEITNNQTVSIDFGSTAILPSTKSRNITIQNQLGNDLTNVVISITGSVFSAVPTPPTTIAGGSSETITVVLSNGTTGSFTETLTITSDDFSGAFQFDLTGVITTLPESEIAVYQGTTITGDEITDNQPDTYYLGSDLRDNDVSNEITITNKGSAVLNISNMSITGSAFNFTSTPPTSIAVGATETVQINLDGSTTGLFRETLTITNDDTDETIFNFDVEGEILGPDIGIFQGTDIYSSTNEIINGQTSSVDFGSNPEGIDVTLEITIANFSPVDLNITDILITGTAFSVDVTAPFIVPGEVDGTEIITFNLSLSGSTPGNFSETITISNDDEDTPSFEFPLSGTINSVPQPEIAIFEVSSASEITNGQPTAISFGSEIQGTDITKQFRIENQGSVDLAISGISFSGSTFSLASTAPTTIGVGLSETIDVILDGASIGVFTETLTILNDDANEGTFDFQITGEITSTPEPEIAVFEVSSASEITSGHPTAISFGSEIQGTDVTKQFRIENQGSADLTISGISFSGSTFSLANTAPTSIGAGLSETIDVILSGNTIGNFTETLTILNDDANESTFDFQITGEITSTTNSLPTISPIADINIDEDGSTGEIPFTITDEETNLNDLIITASSDNLSLVSTSGIVLTGSGGDRAINITPESNADGSTIITVQVDDGQAIVSITFILSVTSVNDVPIITDQELLSTPVNTSINLLLSNFTVLDVDNDYPNGFSLIINDGQNYTVSDNSIMPDLDFVGDLTVPIIINDGNDNSSLFNVTISVIEGELAIDFDGQSLTSGSTISFDDVPVGLEDNQELVITNTGSSTLVITEIDIDGEDFRLNSPLPDPILAGQSISLSIVFQPTSIGSKTAIVTVRSTSAVDFIATLTASGLSEAPALEVFNVVSVQKNGKHDFLEIRNIEFYNSNRVFIHNRWGNEVFKTSDYNNTDNYFSGDSDSGKELPDGTYYYVIELNAGETIENGFFLLRR